MKKGFISAIFLIFSSLIFLKLYFKIDIVDLAFNFFGKENVSRFLDFIKNIYIKYVG